MDTAEDACCDPHMYKAAKHSQDCFVRMGQSQGLVRTDARKNVFFRAQNGKVRNKSKKALTEKGGGDNITEHAAESCEPDL